MGVSLEMLYLYHISASNIFDQNIIRLGSVLFYFTEGDESQERNDLQENMFAPHSVDSVRLTNFLQQAGQVVVCA